MNHAARIRPYSFEFYVFASQSEVPTEEENECGIYLVGEAEARHLEQVFGPLYLSVGIGICTSDDEIIFGDVKLAALSNAIEEAIRDIRERPEQWQILTGYTHEPRPNDPGEAIVRMASRSRLLEFLDGVNAIVQHARAIKGYVHFGGGE